MSQEAGEAIITTSKAGERQGEKPSIERRSQEEMASAGSKADARVTGEASSSSRQPESTRVHSQNRTGTARAAGSSLNSVHRTRCVSRPGVSSAMTLF
eukprot:2483708-Rhodomonas_salina.2